MSLIALPMFDTWGQWCFGSESYVDETMATTGFMLQCSRIDDRIFVLGWECSNVSLSRQLKDWFMAEGQNLTYQDAPEAIIQVALQGVLRSIGLRSGDRLLLTAIVADPFRPWIKIAQVRFPCATSVETNAQGRQELPFSPILEFLSFGRSWSRISDFKQSHQFRVIERRGFHRAEKPAEGVAGMQNQCRVLIALRKQGWRQTDLEVDEPLRAPNLLGRLNRISDFCGPTSILRVAGAGRRETGECMIIESRPQAHQMRDDEKNS